MAVPYDVGERVWHEKYGVGTVADSDGLSSWVFFDNVHDIIDVESLAPRGPTEEEQQLKLHGKGRGEIIYIDEFEPDEREQYLYEKMQKKRLTRPEQPEMIKHPGYYRVLKVAPKFMFIKDDTGEYSPVPKPGQYDLNLENTETGNIIRNYTTSIEDWVIAKKVSNDNLQGFMESPSLGRRRKTQPTQPMTQEPTTTEEPEGDIELKE